MNPVITLYSTPYMDGRWDGETMALFDTQSSTNLINRDLEKARRDGWNRTGKATRKIIHGLLLYCHTEVT